MGGAAERKRGFDTMRAGCVYSFHAFDRSRMPMEVTGGLLGALMVRQRRKGAAFGGHGGWEGVEEAADDPPPKVQNSGCWKGGRQRWTGGESLGIKLQYAIARKATKTLRPFSPKQGGHTQRKRWLWKHLAIVEMFLYTQSRRLSFALFRLSRKAVSKTSRGGAIYIANYDC